MGRGERGVLPPIADDEEGPSPSEAGERILAPFIAAQRSRRLVSKTLEFPDESKVQCQMKEPRPHCPPRSSPPIDERVRRRSAPLRAVRAAGTSHVASV